MILRKAKLLGLVISTLLLLMQPLLAWRQPALADTTSLLASNPTLTSLGTVATGQTLDPDKYTPVACTDMTINVVRGLPSNLVTNAEQHCMVETQNGLMSSDGTVIQPPGFGKAYALSASLLGGNTSLLPIGNQAAVLVLKGDPTYVGVDISVYRDFGSHIHFDALSQKFELTDLPDVSLKFGKGRAMDFNIETMSISDNGRYIVVDVPRQSFMRIDLDTLSITPFATTLPLANNIGPLPAYTAIDDSGQYAAIAYNAPGFWGGVSQYFKVVDVDSCTGQLPNSAYDTPVFACSTTDQYGFLSQQISGLSGFGGVAFVNADTLLLDAFTGGTTAVRYSLTAAGAAARLEDYLAVGDSYISGEGAFAYRDGTDTATNMCHQSILSYPYLIGASAFSSFASVACSGAKVDNVIGSTDPSKTHQTRPADVLPSDLEQKQAEQDHLPGVVAQKEFIAQDNPQVVTISIGGNDVGFSDIVKECIIPFNFGTSTSQNCYQTYEDRLELVNTIDQQFNRLYHTYQLMQNNDPTRRVYVIGYPQTVSPTGACGDNVRLSQSDRQFVAQLIAYLDSVMQAAADKAGAYYVDTQQAFDGHELCQDGTPAVNGLTAGTDGPIVGGVNLQLTGNESYHPNALGHQLLEQTIMSETADLTAPMPAPDSSMADPAPSDSLDILQAPKTGRTIYNIESLGEDALGLLQFNPLEPVTFTLDSYKGLLGSGTNFTAVLHSDPITLGTYQVDADGDLGGNLTIPAGVTPGFHTIHFYGKDVAGNPLDLQTVIYVNASADDYDDDGIPNSSDTCPTIPNSGHDVDQDGIDDACDPVIGPAPAPPAQNQGGQTTPSGSTGQNQPTSSAPSTADQTDESLGDVLPGLKQPVTTQLAAALPIEVLQNFASAPIHSGVLGAATSKAPATVHGQSLTTHTKHGSNTRLAAFGYAAAALLVLVLGLLWRRRTALKN